MLKARWEVSPEAPGEVQRTSLLGAWAGGTGFIEEADLTLGLRRKRVIKSEPGKSIRAQHQEQRQKAGICKVFWRKWTIFYYITPHPLELTHLTHIWLEIWIIEMKGGKWDRLSVIGAGQGGKWSVFNYVETGDLLRCMYKAVVCEINLVKLFWVN